MRTSEDNRNPDEIANDVERTRAELGETIDAIQHKLTPGEMMDQAFNYARTSLPADFGTNLGNAVRNNPLPVALIGVGIAWLAASGQHPRYSTARRSKVDYDDTYDTYETYDTAYAGPYAVEETGSDGEGRMQRAKAKMSETGSRISGKASEAGSRISEKASETGSRLSEKASETGSRISEKASELGHRLGETASSLSGQAREMGSRTVGSARERVGELGHRSQEQYYRARDNVSHMVEEQPLILGVLGMAVGAALGAAFPTTRREDEMMGRTRDDLMEKAKETGRQQAESLKESAKHVADSAKQEANRVASQAQSSMQGQGDGRSGTASSTTSTSSSPGTSQPGRPSIH